MRPILLLRIALVMLVLFLVGHTIGALSEASRGPEEAAVFTAMQTYRFDIMGVTRTHADFYQGLGLYLSAALAIFVWLTAVISGVARRDPATARPMVIAMAVGMTGMAALSWVYFFPAPAVMSTVAAVCFAGAYIGLPGD